MGKEVGMRKSKSREGRGCSIQEEKEEGMLRRETTKQIAKSRFLPIGIVARGGTWHCI